MKTKIYLILFFAFPFISCNSWLDVTPQGQVEASDMLSSEKGYNSALGGVYYTLSSSTLYGKELSYGLMDLLAQYWDVSNSTSHKYYKLAQYDYKDANSVAKFNAIWKEFYSCITQCNLIIASLNKNREDIKYAELFEGETYALRAFVHMELLRLFGPVIRTTTDLDKTGIAYRTEFNVEAKKFDSAREVLNKAKVDLTKALELLKNDPINTVGRKGDKNTSLLGYNDILNRRGSRMNYYAVLGMLARLEQLMLNQDQAYIYAKRIIDESKASKVLTLIDKVSMGSATESWKDLNYSCEMLFALYTNNLYDLTNATFMMEGKGTANSAFPINSALYTTFLNDIYGRQPDGAGTDNRLRYWFVKNGQTNDYYEFKKLKEATKATGLKPPYDPEIPVMRLSEVYYIACEAQIGKDNALALSYLNEVRDTRNLSPIEGSLTNEELLEYLLREQRKDFIGEGRMFPLYKRLFTSFYVKQGVTIEPLEQYFIFPIPDAEYEYSPNVKPNN
ncbi:MAG: RagB/SusD family nutrient uptake outer membrane protein [Odoribacter sp.]